MPTMPKVVAALFFAALGYFAVDLVIAVLPEGQSPGKLHLTMALVGAFCGWIMSGARAGEGSRAGFGYGLTTSALMVFWGLFIFAGVEMLDKALSRRYDQVMEAIQAMVNFGIKYATTIATPEIIATMIVGGLFGGWLTEWAADRWS